MCDGNLAALRSYEREQDLLQQKEEAIVALSEQLSAATSAAISQVARASAYDFEYKLLNNETNGSDEFNEMFYSIAENLINSL
jgi:hypothetical protein